MLVEILDDFIEQERFVERDVQRVVRTLDLSSIYSRRVIQKEEGGETYFTRSSNVVSAC